MILLRDSSAEGGKAAPIGDLGSRLPGPVAPLIIYVANILSSLMFPYLQNVGIGLDGI